MPDVYRFPPVGIVAYENSIDDPMSVSVGINGAARGSQTQANRSVYIASVSGIGDGVGYVETLKTLMAGKLPLVQVDTLPAVWWNRSRVRGKLESQQISWTSEGGPMDWTSGGGELVWYERTQIDATAGNDGFDFIDVTGLDAGLDIHVGEVVQGGGSEAKVLRSVKTLGATVRLYLTSPIPNGDVSIGRPVTRVFRMRERPRVVQSSGFFAYDFDMVEAFASDFSDGFTVLDPWT